MADNEKSPDPDSMDEEALRWGRFVVQHFSPQEGDLFLIKGPSSKNAEEKREEMADALTHAAKEQGIDDIAFIIGPSHLANIHQIPEEEMNRLGYRRISDPDPIPKEQT